LTFRVIYSIIRVENKKKEKIKMQNLKNKILELQNCEFKVSEVSGDFSLYQTQRNEAKKELIEALFKDLKELTKDIADSDAFMTADGPTLSFLNSKVQDQLYSVDENAICSGNISISFNAIFRNLSYDAELESLAYEQEVTEKEAKRKEKEAEKKVKTKRDAEDRAEKVRRKEELKAKLLKE
jgi:hypothetical protein